MYSFKGVQFLKQKNIKSSHKDTMEFYKVWKMTFFVFIVLLLATRSLGKPVQYFRVGVVFSKGSKTLASVHNVERYVSRS